MVLYQLKVTLADGVFVQRFASETFSEGPSSARNRKAIASITMGDNNTDSIPDTKTSVSTLGAHERTYKSMATIMDHTDRVNRSVVSLSSRRAPSAATLLSMAAVRLFGEDPSMNRVAPSGMDDEDFKIGLLLNSQKLNDVDEYKMGDSKFMNRDDDDDDDSQIEYNDTSQQNTPLTSFDRNF
jgi:hypothetical protein